MSEHLEATFITSRSTCNRVPAFIVAASLMAVLVPGLAHAQTLRGRLTDYANDAALTGARIDLIDAHGQEVSRAETDAAGAFVLEAPRAGTYRVRASLIGYHTFTSEPLDLASRDIVELSLKLSVAPIALNPVIVRVRADRSHLAGFEHRRTQNIGGYFLTRSDIERRPVARPSELLVGVPGVRLVPQKLAGIPQDRYLIMLRGTGGPCTAHVFVNGIEVEQVPDTIDDLIHSDWLGGVEVYPTAASAPVEYRQSGNCGVVLLWTREVEQGESMHWIKVAAATAFVVLGAILTGR